MKRILVVDDEPDIVKVVKMRLESKQFEVITAQDGQEALEKARKEKPDLIILDVMLPKLEGFKVCRMLKFDALYKHIPIIMFTARNQAEDKEISKEIGADAHISKPFEPQVLLGKVEELLGIRHV